MKKRVMISQPMRGKTEEQIREERNEVVELLQQEGYEVIDTVFPDFENIEVQDANKPLLYLSKSIEYLSKVDSIYFMDGWQNARGCRIEHQCAVDYGINILELNK